MSQHQPDIGAAHSIMKRSWPGLLHGLGEGLRYGWASAAALLADVAVLSAGYRLLHLPVWLAATLAFCVGMVLIYGLSTRWVFSHRRVDHAPTEFLIFVAIGLFALLINNGVLLAAHVRLGWSPETAKIPAAVLTFLFNFILRRQVLFAAGYETGSAHNVHADD